MDALLTQIQQPASRDRRNLLDFAARFEKKLLESSASYELLYTQRNQALKTQQQKAQEQLSALDASHQKITSDLTAAQKTETERLHKEMLQRNREKEQRDAQEQKSFEAWKAGEQDTLKKRAKKDARVSGEEAKRVEQYRELQNDCKILDKWGYNHATENMDIHLQAGLSEATILQEESYKKVEERCEKRSLYTSTIGKVLLHFTVADTYREVEAALRYAEAAHQNNDRRRNTAAVQREQEFRNETAKRSQVLSRKKQSSAKLCSQQTQALQQSLTAVKNQYSQRMTQEEQKYQSARTGMLNRQKADRTQLEQTWEVRLADARKLIVKNLNDHFPPQQVYALVKANYDEAVRFSGKLPGEAMRNVFLGRLVIYARNRKWYDGALGAFLADYLKKNYACLFYPVSSGGKTEADSNYFTLPYLFSLERGENLFIRCQDVQLKAMETAAQSMAMRLLCAVPAGQFSMLLADTAAIGSLSALAALDPAVGNQTSASAVKSILDGEKICSSAADVQQRIQDNANRYNLSAGQLGNISSLREYNKNNPMNTRSFLLSFLQRFPNDMDKSSLDALTKMARACGKWGYSSIITGTDSDYKKLDEKLVPNVTELYRQCTCMVMQSSGWLMIQNGSHPMETGAMLAPLGMPTPAEIAGIKQMLRDGMSQASKVFIDFEKAADLCPAPDRRYTGNSRDGVVVPLGYYDGGAPFHMIFDDNRVHTLINGAPGSGKTNLMHVLITNILLRYSPEEVQLYVVDFKHGNEFQRYTSLNLPSFKMISIYNEPEFALKMLRTLEEELKRRSALFGAIPNLQQYRIQTGKPLPRIVVILDELFELVSAAKTSAGNARLKDEIMKILATFAVQARAYGIHMVLSGQNMSEISEISSIKNSCDTRIAMRCPPEQVSALIGSEGEQQMRMIPTNASGTCVVKVGLTAEPNIQHTAHLEPKVQHIRILQEIHRHYVQQKQYTGVQILTGNVAANFNTLYQRYLAVGDLSLAVPGRFYLGESLTMGVPSCLDLQGKNLWVCGGQSMESRTAGKSVCYFALLSLLLQKKAKQSDMQIYFLNGSTTTQAPLETDDRAGQLCLTLIDQVKFSSGERFATLVERLHQEMVTRKNSPKPDAPPIWLILQKPEECPNKTAQHMQMLQELLQYGPMYRIQTVIYTRQFKQAEPFRLTEISIGERYVLEMETGAMEKVLGKKPAIEPKAWILASASDNRLRSYELPEEAWNKAMAARLAK